MGLKVFFILLFPVFLFASNASIITSFSILEDITQNLVPDSIRVESLIPAEQDPHGYQSTASNFIALKKADLVLLVGMNFDAWADKYLEQMKQTKNRYYVTSNLSTLDEHDPHFWQSPLLVSQMVQNLSTILKQKFPKHEKEIHQKTASYLEKIRALQTKTQKDLESVPLEKRKVVVAHNAFAYLGTEYNLQFLSPVPNHSHGEASIKNVQNLIQKIRDEKITAFFFEKSVSKTLIEKIAKSTQNQVAGTLYSDSLAATGPASTYLGFLEYNLSLIAKTLKGTK